jgi:hypothetical protein
MGALILGDHARDGELRLGLISKYVGFRSCYRSIRRAMVIDAECLLLAESTY